MLNNDFLEFLEYRICKLYDELHPKKKMKHWCKDIVLSQPDHNYSHEYVIENKQVLLKAFVDKYGYMEYDVHLKFGKQALLSYSKGIDIKKNIPSNKKRELFTIDFEQNRIDILLS